MGTARYAAAPVVSRLAASKATIVMVSLAAWCALMLVAWRGLFLGKGLSSAGTFITVTLFSAVILVAILHWFDGSRISTPIALSAPADSLLHINILGNMSSAALCVVDSVAVLAGDCRSKDMVGAIRRSVAVSDPVIAAMMILGTATLLRFSHPDSIDLLMPPIQMLCLAWPHLAQIATVLIVLMLLAGGCLCLSALSRFPMVAGWDHILPDWFSRLDPR